MFRTIVASLALAASVSAGTSIFQTFEGDGFDDWQVEGEAFGLAPSTGKTDDMGQAFNGYSDDSLACSGHGGMQATGSLTSPGFVIREPYIAFLIAGGNQPGKTAAQLLIDGKTVRETTGERGMRCKPGLWDVSEYKGANARIRLIDDDAGEWGIIGVDQIIFTDYPNPKFPPTTRGGKAFVEGLATTDVLTGASIPIDSQLKVEASHKTHQVTSPTAITFDDQGRVYVAETHRFAEGVEDDRRNLFWYLDDLAAKTTADRRALHEKWKSKVPLERLTRHSEVVRRLADTDGDGTLDESTVFADGFNDVLDGTAAGVFHFEGCIYFACIPKIHMLPTGAGGGRQVVADGFGVRISLSGHDLNGFTLGPDGRIWGTLGDRGMSLITREGVAYDYPNEGVVFRFEPDGSGFEIFHTGLRNPKEIAFDALGNAFSVDNNSDQGDAARVVYLVEGGDSGWEMEHQTMHTFHRQIGLSDRPPSRWMNEKMWELENPAQPAYALPPIAHLSAGPSGLTVHPGVGFLEKEASRFLVCDYRGGAANSGIWSFEMKSKGAGMEMTDSRQFLWGVAATDVEYSWDGRVFVSDFVTGWRSHQEGRLLSVSAGERTWRAAEAASTAAIMKEGFDHRDSAGLLKLMSHLDARIRLRAQIALTRMPDAFERLSEATTSADFATRLHGIWGLGILSRRGPVPTPFGPSTAVPTAESQDSAGTRLVALLADKDPEIRAQVLRVLADAKVDTDSIPIEPLLSDESLRVRFFAAMVVGKQKMAGSFVPVCEMLAENNNRDVYLRHAGIYALQHASASPAILSALANTYDSPAVRLAAVVALRRMGDPGVSAFIRDADPKVADEAIRAICDKDLVSQRPAVAALLDDVSSRAWSPFMLRRLIHNAFRIGTPENAARLLKTAADPQIPDAVRQETFRLLKLWAEPHPVDQLTGHWNPLEKRDPETLRPSLIAALPGLLRQQGFVLAAALDLVAQYKLEIDGLDEHSLEILASNSENPADARATALRLLIGKKPQNLETLLTRLAADPFDEVALTALNAIASLAPGKALPALEAAVNSSMISRAQKTWEILASLPGEEADAIFIREINKLSAAAGVSPTAVELTAAAAGRDSPAVAGALASLQESLAASKDPLARWNASLQGGDPVAGAALFASHPGSQCMRCHRAEDGHGAGGEAAPNLAGIANRHQDHRYFLESMVLPNNVITPGYGAVLIDFKNGAGISGNLVAESAEHLDIDSAGKLLRVKRSDIASFTPPVSSMPPMDTVLSAAELRDIVAWLASLTEGGDTVKSAAEPVPLDPATLEIPEKPAAPADSAGIDPAFMKSGKQQFLVCGACHGQSGEGTAAGPPLAGSEWVTGPEENLIRIQLRGLKGPIKVKGVEYNFPAGMAPMAYQSDEQIAAVLTYVRNSFGNSAPPVTAAAVAALRGEVGKPQLSAAELLPPTPTPTPTPPPAPPPAPAATPAAAPEKPAAVAPGKYDHLTPPSSRPKWLAVALLVGVLAFLSQAFFKK
jgi:quinoprotein glucose dehydrogenase